MKIVINKCYGGFGLSKEAMDLYLEKKGMQGEKIHPLEIERDDPVLVEVVEELGILASGNYAEVEVVDIPDDVKWEIEEYDGNEWVAEVHRTWR
jgi:hypothetical protein